ncbi:MAG: hypothetical protein U0165_06710 [Polyangiaceae bacterium]
MAKVKASAVLSRLQYATAHHGAEGASKLLAALPAESRALISTSDAHAWLPLEVFIQVNVEADRLWGNGDLSLCYEMGKFGAEANLPTLYRIFYRIGSPMFILSKAARLWEVHYDSGHLLPIQESPSVIRLKISGFSHPHRAHCLSVLGWASRSVELTGAHLLDSHEQRCRLRGDPACELVIAWR